MKSLINVSAIATEVRDAFEDICTANPDLKLELSAKGELITLSPTGMETGDKNSRLISRFVVWNESTNPEYGVVFDSSTGFRLPNGALRSPDVSWISREKWQTVPPKERKRFALIAPDFVLELMSDSDNLKDIQNKMLEYMEAGVKLGWLINPQTLTVEIYRSGLDKEVLINPSSLSGENVLPNFVMSLNKIF